MRLATSIIWKALPRIGPSARHSKMAARRCGHLRAPSIKLDAIIGRRWIAAFQLAAGVVDGFETSRLDNVECRITVWSDEREYFPFNA